MISQVSIKWCLFSFTFEVLDPSVPCAKIRLVKRASTNIMSAKTVRHGYAICWKSLRDIRKPQKIDLLTSLLPSWGECWAFIEYLLDPIEYYWPPLPRDLGPSAESPSKIGELSKKRKLKWDKPLKPKTSLTTYAPILLFSTSKRAQGRHAYVFGGVPPESTETHKVNEKVRISQKQQPESQRLIC